MEYKFGFNDPRKMSDKELAEDYVAHSTNMKYKEEVYSTAGVWLEDNFYTLPQLVQMVKALELMNSKLDKTMEPCSDSSLVQET